MTSEAFSFLPRIWNAVKCGYSLTKGAQTSTDSHISDNGHSSCLLVQKKAKGLRLPAGHVCFLGFRLSVNKKKGGEGRIPQSLSSEVRHSVCVYHFLRAEGHCETTLSLSKVVCASLGLLQKFPIFFTLMNWSHPQRRRFFLSLLWWRRLSLAFSRLRVIHLVKVQSATLWRKKKS